MALTSLKREPDEDMASYRPNQYGYGTEICLDSEQCEALGITKALKAGQMVTMRAAGVVTSSTEMLEASSDSGGKDVCLRIQITDLDLKATGGASAAKAAAMLYGEDD